MANAIPVLVVEDDAVSSAQLGALARAAGYDARSAPNGREAWDLLQLTRIQIVISDWYMPEMDGPELCRRILARQRLGRKRLREVRRPRLENAMPHHRVVGVPRRVEDLHIRPHVREPLRQLTPGHARHHNVRQE